MPRKYIDAQRNEIDLGIILGRLVPNGNFLIILYERDSDGDPIIVWRDGQAQPTVQQIKDEWEVYKTQSSQEKIIRDQNRLVKRQAFQALKALDLGTLDPVVANIIRLVT